MRQPEGATLTGQAPAPSRGSADRVTDGLLVAIPVLSAVGVMLVMERPSPAVAWGLLAALIGLVVVASLVVPLWALGAHVAARRRRSTRDPWAERWEELLLRTVR